MNTIDNTSPLLLRLAIHSHSPKHLNKTNTKRTTIIMGQESIATTTTVGNVVGGGKFVHIGVFLFICLGLALLYPINTIISATDWFMYIYPTTANISGVLSNADFVASVVSSQLLCVYLTCVCEVFKINRQKEIEIWIHTSICMKVLSSYYSQQGIKDTLIPFYFLFHFFTSNQSSFCRHIGG